MDMILALLVLFSFLALITGILSPKSFGAKMTRKKAIKRFGLTFLGLFFLVGIVANSEEAGQGKEQYAVSQSEDGNQQLEGESAEPLIRYARMEDITQENLRKLVEQQLINIQDPARLLREAKAHLESDRLTAANVLLGTIVRKRPSAAEVEEAKSLLETITRENPDWVEQLMAVRKTQAAKAQRENRQSQATQEKSKAEETLEYKLACINAGERVQQDHITVARFRSLLSQLSGTFVEDRQQISDMSVKATQVLRQDGISESLLNIMEGMNQIFSQKIENQKYAEYIAMYLTLRDKGQSHKQAIDGIRSLLAGFGVR